MITKEQREWITLIADAQAPNPRIGPLHPAKEMAQVILTQEQRLNDLETKVALILRLANINPCATCGYAGTCGDPPGEECHT